MTSVTPFATPTPDALSDSGTATCLVKDKKKTDAGLSDDQFRSLFDLNPIHVSVSMMEDPVARDTSLIGQALLVPCKTIGQFTSGGVCNYHEFWQRLIKGLEKHGLFPSLPADHAGADLSSFEEWKVPLTVSPSSERQKNVVSSTEDLIGPDMFAEPNYPFEVCLTCFSPSKGCAEIRLRLVFLVEGSSETLVLECNRGRSVTGLEGFALPCLMKKVETELERMSQPEPTGTEKTVLYDRDWKILYEDQLAPLPTGDEEGSVVENKAADSAQKTILNGMMTSTDPVLRAMAFRSAAQRGLPICADVLKSVFKDLPDFSDDERLSLLVWLTRSASSLSIESCIDWISGRASEAEYWKEQCLKDMERRGGRIVQARLGAFPLAF